MERDDQVGGLYDAADTEELAHHQDMLQRERDAREALDRCAKAGAKAEDLTLLASECGITNYKPKG